MGSRISTALCRPVPAQVMPRVSVEHDGHTEVVASLNSCTIQGTWPKFMNSRNARRTTVGYLDIARCVSETAMCKSHRTVLLLDVPTQSQC